MALHYYCRHCGHELGQLNDHSQALYQSVYDYLSAEERNDILGYDEVGNVKIKAICEDCHDALRNSPDFHSLDYLIQ